MLFKYERERCNICSCQQKQTENFMCDQHNHMYLTDKDLKERMNRQVRLVNGTANFKDKYKFYRNFIIHYLTGIHVPYIEHYPFETVFLYYYPMVARNQEAKLNFTIEQFVSDFEFKENVYLDHLKVHKDTSSFFQPFNEFTAKRKSHKRTMVFILIWFIFFASHSILKTFGHSIQYKNLWDSIVFILLTCSTVFYSGVNFLNRTKDIIQEALSGTLLSSKEDNKRFLKNAHNVIEKIKTMEENLYIMYGAMFAVAITTIYRGYKNMDIITLETSIIYFFYSIISAILIFMLFELIWNNMYLIRLVRRLPNKNWRFNLYEKERNIGISAIRNYAQSLVIYNFFVIISVNISYINMKNIGIDISFLSIVLVSFFFAMNYSSNFIFFWKYNSIKREFRAEKSKELIALKKSSSAASITKYDFIKGLKLNFLFESKLKKPISFLLYLIPIVASYLFSKYSVEIGEWISQILVSIESWIR